MSAPGTPLRRSDRARAAGPRSLEGGFTLLEVTIAAAILTSLAAILFSLLARAQDLEGQTIARADLRTRLHLTLGRIARELRDSGPSTFDMEPIAPLGASGLTFRRATGYQSGAIVWGPPVRFERRTSAGEIEDGIDNDGDGLIDEGSVVWIENPGANPTHEIVLCDGVSRLATGETADLLDNNGNLLIDESGLSFEYDPVDTLLTVRLALECRLGRGERVQVSGMTSIQVRNP